METETISASARKLFPSRFYDAFFLNEYGRIEALRATRYNTTFSAVMMDFGGIDEQGAEFMKKLASAVVESVRNCDVAGLADDRRVVIILPETDHFGAMAAIRKLARALPLAQGAAIFSHATFPRDGKSFAEIMAVAARRASERKQSLWERLELGGRLFWEIVGELTSKDYAAPEAASFDAGAGLGLSEFFIDQVNELIVREITRAPQRRGVMYYGVKSLSASLPVAKLLGSSGAVATRVFLVGEGSSGLWDPKNATPLLFDDPRLRETFFTFFLSEETAYALICKENWGETFSCFHTSDSGLVEGLIAKFQQEYSLQEQLG